MSDPTKDQQAEGTEVETPGDLPEGTVSPEDEQRRRFREALDRKKFAHHAGGAGANPNAQHPHTAPAKPQKTFRRKSG